MNMNPSGSKQAKPRIAFRETIGKRIAQLRLSNGWTQQDLAARLAISRVAVSHIEMDLIIPSERTITLLAGIFKLTPYELVDTTTYPKAKTEKLPEVTCCYTKLELELALLRNDLTWLGRLSALPNQLNFKEELLQKWAARLSDWAMQCLDEREREMIAVAQKLLLDIKVD
jgi:transcriptional regulator with XRE-family HTH domain